MTPPGFFRNGMTPGSSSVENLKRQIGVFLLRTQDIMLEKFIFTHNPIHPRKRPNVNSRHSNKRENSIRSKITYYCFGDFTSEIAYDKPSGTRKRKRSVQERSRKNYSANN